MALVGAAAFKLRACAGRTYRYRITAPSRFEETSMSTEPTQTLGQRIDALLEPLYAEAEQYRATIAEVAEQQQALQQKKDAANEGLGQIESRMAEVVRAMAQQDPVIAAVVGDAAQAVEAEAEPVEQAQPSPAQDEPEAPQVQAQVESTEPQAQAEAEAEDEPESDSEPVGQADATEQEAPAVELDPAADAQVVDEAAALLDAEPAEAEAEPEVDLAAAAERAAAAAKQLREKAAAK